MDDGTDIEDSQFGDSGVEAIRIQDHPRLQGLLLAANQRIDDSGDRIFVIVLLTLALCYFLLANDFKFGDFDLGPWAAWHSCLFVLVGHFIVFGLLNGRAEEMAYREMRGEILAKLRVRELDLYELIAAMNMTICNEYREVLTHLKKEDGARTGK